MNDKPEIIRQIEEIFGFPIEKVNESEIRVKNFFSVSPGSYGLGYSESPVFPYKGRRGYSADENNNITCLSLDFSPVFLLPVSFLALI